MPLPIRLPEPLKGLQRIPLAWLQLTRQPVRLAVALAGIGFAALLMFIQLGFRDGLFESSVTMHKALNTDLVLISPQSTASIAMKTFPLRRLYQALAFPEVESVSALHLNFVNWKNPVTRQPRSIMVLGFDPKDAVLRLPGLTDNLRLLQLPDQVLFDEKSREEFGPVAAQFKQGKSVETEVGSRRVTVGGLFAMGATFGADGNLITGDQNYLRLFPQATKGEAEVGLIRVKPGTDIPALVTAMRQALPEDVRVLTKAGFMDFERNYWATSTAIGFIFSLGAVMGFVVGGVIVYQILYSDVSDHLAEYATLKAMGYSDRYLLTVVFQEAIILAVLGYIPGFLLTLGLYDLTRNATAIPVFMTGARATLIFNLTLVMCFISGAIAVRRLSAADPADVF